VFRNLKKATDDAIALFSNKDAKEIIFVEPYEKYVERFNEAVANLRELTPTPNDVDLLVGEEQELKFVTNFRELLRLRNILIAFADFKIEDTTISAQTFVDFRSKYLDIYDKVRSEHEKEKVSILDDVDFMLELVRRDEINVDYIIRLLARYVDASDDAKKAILNNIFNVMSADDRLRSKKELIEKFIKTTVPKITDSEEVENKFEEFWSDEKTKAFERMCNEEGLMTEKLQNLIDNYLYSGRKPRGNDLVGSLTIQPKILERESIVKRLLVASQPNPELSEVTELVPSKKAI